MSDDLESWLRRLLDRLDDGETVSGHRRIERGSVGVDVDVTARSLRGDREAGERRRDDPRSDDGDEAYVVSVREGDDGVDVVVDLGASPAGEPTARVAGDRLVVAVDGEDRRVVDLPVADGRVVETTLNNGVFAVHVLEGGEGA